MADNNLSPSGEPVVTTLPTEDQLVDDLANLLEPPETDQPTERKEGTAAAPETDDDDPLGLNAEDVENADEPDEADDADGPDAEIKGGRFAPDNAKLKLDTGETITVRDLKDRVDKRVREFQRDYTEKTTALKGRESEVDQYAQSLDQFREYVTQYAEQYLPNDPGPYKGAPDDYVAFHDWQLATSQYQTHVNAYQVFQQQKQAGEQRQAGETQKQTQERLGRERDALLKAMPVLKDPVKGKQVLEAISKGAAEHYGLSDEDLRGISSHVQLVILRDALELKRIKLSAKSAPAEVARKPAVRDGRRAPATQQATRERQARTEQLRKTHSFEDGVAALQDFDL